MEKKIERNHRKIIFLGSDLVMTYLFEQVLATHGFRLLSVSAFSSAQVLELAHTEKPIAIIIDTDRLDKQKLDLLKKLKFEGTTSNIPVFATTPHWRDFGENAFLCLGFDGLIKQPIDIPEVGKILNNMIKTTL